MLLSSLLHEIASASQLSRITGKTKGAGIHALVHAHVHIKMRGTCKARVKT